MSKSERVKEKKGERQRERCLTCSTTCAQPESVAVRQSKSTQSRFAVRVKVTCWPPADRRRASSLRGERSSSSPPLSRSSLIIFIVTLVIIIFIVTIVIIITMVTIVIIITIVTFVFVITMVTIVISITIVTIIIIIPNVTIIIIIIIKIQIQIQIPLTWKCSFGSARYNARFRSNMMHDKE